MRVIGLGSQEHTTVEVLDEPGQGGACHEYIVKKKQPSYYDHW
jgi:hypothetical protein